MNDFNYRTREEKVKWLGNLLRAIKDLYQRKSSLKVEVFRPPDAEIGFAQPRLMRLDSCTKCHECAQVFSMLRKRYHCKACGNVKET